MHKSAGSEAVMDTVTSSRVHKQRCRSGHVQSGRLGTTHQQVQLCIAELATCQVVTLTTDRVQLVQTTQ